MTEITEAQVEAAAKVYRKHTKDIEYMGILCKCDTYCEDRADHETHRMRSALEAAQAAAPVVDVEKLTTGLAEMLYDDQTGTRGKFATSIYRDAWVNRVGTVVEDYMNGGGGAK